MSLKMNSLVLVIIETVIGIMKSLVGILILSAFAVHVNCSDEILKILNTAKDLTLQEVNALRPLFDELQKQYDLIGEATEKERKNDVVAWQKEIWPAYNPDDYVNLFENLTFQPILEISAVEYETKLPTLEELIGNIDLYNEDLSKEQLAELEDLNQLVQEILDEAQSSIDEIVQRSLPIESELLKLNKPKIVGYIFNALSSLFQYSVRFRRAAYCIYSHVPQLNESLQIINSGVGCYKYATQLVLQVQTQTINTVSTIRGNIFNLAKIYKKIAAKKSIFGKVVTAVLNFPNISRNTLQTYSVGVKALNKLQNNLPHGIVNSVQCGTDFAMALPQIKSTVVNVTTCITFVDDTPVQYEFLLPESERTYIFNDSN